MNIRVLDPNKRQKITLFTQSPNYEEQIAFCLSVKTKPKSICEKYAPFNLKLYIQKKKNEPILFNHILGDPC